jgi:hypothetical protein
MALQRTRRPRLRSGRSLRSLGSPLNARLLGGTLRSIGWGVGLLSLFLISQVAAGGDAVRIEVESSWSGLAPEVIGAERPRQRSITILCHENDCRGADGAIPRSRVAHFLGELIAKPNSGPELSDLGLSNPQLDAIVRLATDLNRSSERPAERYEAVRRFLLDRVKLEQLVRKHYDPGTTRTDDSPRISGKASWAGEDVEFTSTSYRFFMIPWKVSREHSSSTTYNAELSRALAALLPSDFINLNRLRDAWFHHWLVDQAWAAVSAEARRTKQ